MNAVGDRAERALREHSPRDVCVPNRDTVDTTAEENREVRKIKDAAAGLCQTGQDTGPFLSEDFLDEIGVKVVVTCIDGCMRGEDTLLSHLVDAGVHDGAAVVEAGVLLEKREREEAGVAFVHVVGMKVAIT